MAKTTDDELRAYRAEFYTQLRQIQEKIPDTAEHEIIKRRIQLQIKDTRSLEGVRKASALNNDQLLYAYTRMYDEVVDHIEHHGLASDLPFNPKASGCTSEHYHVTTGAAEPKPVAANGKKNKVAALMAGFRKRISRRGTGAGEEEKEGHSDDSDSAPSQFR